MRTFIGAVSCVVFPVRVHKIPLAARAYRAPFSTKSGPRPPAQPENLTEQAENARASQRLWDTFVPERNWSILSPQFLTLLVATVILYTYNRLNPKSPGKAKALLDEDRDRHNEIVKGSQSS